jgi:DoxX-like family
MAMTVKTVAYWVATGVLVFNLLTGGLAELAQLQGNADGMRALGYPLYMMTILGIWKVLGSIAMVVPGWPRLKEWAYAGAFFNLTGAAVSHIVMGDEAWHAYYTASMAIITLISWALRPESRTLGAPLFRAHFSAIGRTRSATSEVRA